MRTLKKPVSICSVSQSNDAEIGLAKSGSIWFSAFFSKCRTELEVQFCQIAEPRTGPLVQSGSLPFFPNAELNFRFGSAKLLNLEPDHRSSPVLVRTWFEPVI